MERSSNTVGRSEPPRACDRARAVGPGRRRRHRAFDRSIDRSIETPRGRDEARRRGEGRGSARDLPPSNGARPRPGRGARARAHSDRSLRTADPSSSSRTRPTAFRRKARARERRVRVVPSTHTNNKNTRTAHHVASAVRRSADATTIATSVAHTTHLIDLAELRRVHAVRRRLRDLRACTRLERASGEIRSGDARV